MLQSPADGTGRGKLVFWLLATLVVGMASINNQSFWIDESVSARLSSLPSLRDVWDDLREANASDIQAPLYVFYSWCWEKIFGHSEILLRASNIPLLMFGGFLFRRHPLALLLFLCSPFIVYYTGEFRLYLFLSCASVWVAHTLLVARDDQGHIPLTRFYGSVLLMCSISMIGVMWAVGVLAAFLIICGSRLGSRSFWKATVPWIVPFALLGAYYAVILLDGSTPVKIQSSIAINVAQSVYEVLGFSGLGPSRLSVREGLIHALPWIPWLALFAAVVCPPLAVSFFKWAKSVKRSEHLALAAAVIVPLCVLAVLTVIRDFRFSGRHCSPLFGYYIVLLTYGYTRGGWREWSRWNKASWVAVFLLFVVSSANVRFHPRFERENYRDAVTYANTQLAQGKKVVWLAVIDGARWYGLDDRALPGPGNQWAEADEIVYSRLDLFPHEQGNIMELIKKEHYRVEPLCQGFTVLKRDKNAPIK